MLGEATCWVAMAGFGPLEHELAPRMRSAGRFLVGRLEYPGEVADFYRSINVLVVASRNVGRWEEQASRAIAEGMLSSTVVVATDAGSNPEMVGSDGIVVAQDVPSLALGIARGLRAAASQDLGRQARERAIELFSVGASCAHIFRHLDSSARDASSLLMWLNRNVLADPELRELPIDRTSREPSSRGFKWGFLDQGLSSATNFGLVLLAGRLLGPSGLGAVAVGLAGYLVALGFQRALISEPLVAVSSAEPARIRDVWTRRSLSIVLLGGGASAAVLALLGLTVGGRSGEAALLFAIWLIPVLLQDFLRAVLFRDGRASAAAANDGIWLAAMVVAVPLAWEVGTEWAVVSCWGFGGLAGAILGLVQTRVTADRLAASCVWWWRELWSFGRWLAATSLIYSVFTTVTVIALVGILGEQTYGGLQAVMTIYAPLSLVRPAVALPGLPAVSRTLVTGEDAAKRLSIRLAISVMVLTAMYVGVASLAGEFVLSALFGNSFSAFSDLRRGALGIGVRESERRDRVRPVTESASPRTGRLTQRHRRLGRNLRLLVCVCRDFRVNWCSLGNLVRLGRGICDDDNASLKPTLSLMRVLVLHSTYLSGQASGENRTVDEEIRLLREAGHSVGTLLPARRTSKLLGPPREALSAVWSTDASERVRRLCVEQRPDVVHCHNLFPALSPAVLRAATGASVPVVQTLQNYRLLCLPATFLRDGQLCELCLARNPWRGVVHRCYRDSLGGSAALAASLIVHRRFGSFDRVTLYLAASQFVRTKHVEAGFPAGRIVVKPNFAWKSERREGSGEFFLYAGRLAPEKDVATVISAVARIGAKLVIAGTGPDEAALRRTAPPGVDFLGLVRPSRVQLLLRGARALVVPSLSYEGAPVSVVEAYAAGVPVIANRIGALPEFVTNDRSGLLVPSRDPAALARALEQLSDDREAIRLGAGAWKMWSDRYTPEHALRALEAAYKRALECHGDAATAALL